MSKKVLSEVINRYPIFWLNPTIQRRLDDVTLEAEERIGYVKLLSLVARRGLDLKVEYTVPLFCCRFPDLRGLLRLNLMLVSSLMARLEVD